MVHGVLHGGNDSITQLWPTLQVCLPAIPLPEALVLVELPHGMRDRLALGAGGLACQDGFEPSSVTGLALITDVARVLQKGSAAPRGSANAERGSRYIRPGSSRNHKWLLLLVYTFRKGWKDSDNSSLCCRHY